MYNVLISGFETKEQAEQFIHWYVDAGEQDSEIWMMEACRISCLVADIPKTYKYDKNGRNGKIIWEGNTALMGVRPVPLEDETE